MMAHEQFGRLGRTDIKIDADTELKNLYGNKVKYFGGDPFHECGNT